MVMSVFHMKDTVHVAWVGPVKVSTVALWTGRGYETALFWRAGWCEVVDWYPTEDLALAGHAAWCDPKRIREAVKEATSCQG